VAELGKCGLGNVKSQDHFDYAAAWELCPPTDRVWCCGLSEYIVMVLHLRLPGIDVRCAHGKIAKTLVRSSAYLALASQSPVAVSSSSDKIVLSNKQSVFGGPDGRRSRRTANERLVTFLSSENLR
jgi:hypothetical protein